MTPPSLSSSRPLPHRLNALTLGLGAAAAAGAFLPEKADASFPMVHGIQVDTTSLSAPGTGYLNILPKPGDFSDPIGIYSGFNSGWNLRFQYFSASSGGFSTGIIYGSGNGSNYQFLSGDVYSASQTFNLATLSAGYWSNFVSFDADRGETYFVGIRETFSNRYGWTQVTTGSLTHVQTALNFDAGGAITIGQGAIPEPSRAVLLAGGLAGLALARRKRRQSAA